jgi:cell division protease FtsH
MKEKKVTTDTKDESKKEKTSRLSPLKKVKAIDYKKPWYKNPFTLLVILFLLSALIGKFLTLDNQKNELDFGQMVTRVKNNDYEKVEVTDSSVKLFPKNKEEKPATAENISKNGFKEALKDVGVNPDREGIFYKDDSSSIDRFISIISTLALIIFIGVIGFSFFSARNMASGGPMIGFGETKAKLFVGKKQDITFSNVQGAEEAVEEVREIVSFLKTPDKYLKMGARIPKGVLLYGPPGTGKTLLARAIAGEAGVPFFFTSGSEFEEMLVGTGASRVRDLFSKAKKAAPSIIFIDEIDSIAKKRGLVLNSGNTEQTLNQILVEMDGFDARTNVIVIAATNRPDVLDPAILRPGRFDRRIVLELPDVKGREEILKVHAKNKPLAADLNLEVIAKRTIGFSGADLENMLNEAAIIAAQADRKEIQMEDIEESATKVMIGPAKKRPKSEKQKKLVAYHEAGHAVAAYYLKDTDKIHRISIVSRGFTGGVTMYLPNEDDYELRTEAKFKADLISLYGGRIAEKLAMDSISTGASNDIQRATQIAKDMVRKYGMSSLGYIDFNKEEGEYYMGGKDYSDKTAENIDMAVKEILAEAEKRCEEILSQNRPKLDKVADILMEKEVIESEEFYELMK